MGNSLAAKKKDPADWLYTQQWHRSTLIPGIPLDNRNHRHKPLAVVYPGFTPVAAGWLNAWKLKITTLSLSNPGKLPSIETGRICR